MIYLEKVEVILENGEYRGIFEALSRELAGVGVECVFERPEVGHEGKNKAEENAGDEVREPGERELTGIFDRKEMIAPKGVLWITDSATTADRLQRAGCPVLVFLHEKNREASFGECRYVFEAPGVPDIAYLDRVYRRFLRLPWDILETERCLVRETTEADVEEFYRIYKEPSITYYMEELYEDPAEERAYAEEYIDKVYNFYEFGIWTVTEKSTGEVIGRAGICYREGYEDPEIGFLIAVPWQGKGYATEVCRAILVYADEELGFHRILAFVQPENEISLHLCRKLGMRDQGRVKLQGTEYLVLCQEHFGAL